eukprot:TRINITY_DN289_c0_g1_i8.p1 TRINITY_DN289_c0_g1~~TRINITY_DN289_c0_g1_i8.p1  ORF type:complete len:542 (+),score=157.94 TRINITY_DN289_c0_g1_i8:119-1627(+)
MLETVALRDGAHFGTLAKPAVLVFTAAWSEPSRALVAGLRGWEGVTVATVDAESDELESLVERFEVTSVPTCVVVDGSGTVTGSVVGYDPAALERAVQSAISATAATTATTTATGTGSGSGTGIGSGGEIAPESHYEPTVWIAEMAPLPADVVWNNLGVPKSTGSVKKTIFLAVTALLVLFWAIPVGFCGSITNLAGISGIGVVFRPFLTLPPVILGLIATYLPVVVLIVFNALLPSILSFFTTQEGVVSHSERTSTVLVKFYVFTMFSVIVIPAALVGGISKVNSVGEEFKDDPFGTILELIAEITSPGTSMYIGLLLSSGVIGGCVLMLQAPSLILGRLARALAVTPHQMQLALAPPVFSHHTAYAGLLLGLSVTLLFCITLPITTLFGLIFIGFSSLSVKYALAFVFQTSPPSSGTMTRAAVRMLLVTLAVLQTATVMMLFAKHAVIQGAIALLFSSVSVLVMGAVNDKLDAVFESDLYVAETAAGSGSGSGSGDPGAL